MTRTQGIASAPTPTPAPTAPGGSRGFATTQRSAPPVTPGFRRGLLFTSVLCAVLVCNGCTPPVVDDAPPVTPTYSQLVNRYNANIIGLDRLWCGAVVEIIWKDDKGKHHYQAGDGNVMLVLPRQLALSVSKVGVGTLLWFGCDWERYWIIDMRNEEEKKAYFGRHELVDASARPDAPTAIPPGRVPLLLGLLRLDPRPNTGTPPKVEYRDGAYVIQPPELDARIGIDPKTALPVLVELLDAEGKPIVTSLLGKPGRVKRYDVDPDAWPRIMTRVKLRTPDSGDELRLHLERMTDVRAPSEKRKRKALKRAFDLDYLAEEYEAELVDLDAQPERP